MKQKPNPKYSLLTPTELNLLRVCKEYNGHIVLTPSPGSREPRARVIDQNGNPVKTYPIEATRELIKRGLLVRRDKKLYLSE